MSAFEYPTLPRHAPGLSIGLLGGSFNPAHDGHRHISVLAMKRLRLDYVWWLVSPGNPHKDNQALPSAEERAHAARRVASHPRIKVSSFEERVGTVYTHDTLRELQGRAPTVDFVWLMGADNLATFHRWDHWKSIAQMMPIAVIDRPGYTFRALSSPAGHALSQHRLDNADAPLLARSSTPAWCFVAGPRSTLSSTDLRQANGIG